MPSDLARPWKLFALQSWVELASAAVYLTQLVGEPVSSSDLLRLALDGHLTLSVRFLSAVAVERGSTIPGEEAEVQVIPSLEGDQLIMVTKGTPIPGGKVIVWEDRIAVINDIWDLPMIGGERLEVVNLYETSLLRYAPEVFNLEGAFVTDGQGTYCRIMERFEGKPKDEALKYQPYHPSLYYPAAGLPETCVIVVRTQAVRDLAARLGKAEIASRPVGTRERTTLLTIIGALAELAKVNIRKPSSAAAAIESQTAIMGARVAARTIEGYLKRIPEALEAKER